MPCRPWGVGGEGGCTPWGGGVAHGGGGGMWSAPHHQAIRVQRFEDTWPGPGLAFPDVVVWRQ